MNNDNELILLNFLLLLESLETYIEKAGHFSNFTRQLRNITIPKEVEKRSTLHNSEELFKCRLLLFGGVLGDDASNNTRWELRTKYFQWLNTGGIEADNCPEKLKHFFLEIMDIIEKSSEKIFQEQKDRLYRKKKEKPFQPEEYAKIFGEVGNIINNPPQLPSPDIIKGNAETGKETFQKIASSVSASDRQNFHFYPSLTEEERKEREQKEQEENQNDPLLEGIKINAINEIKVALNIPPPPPITVSELNSESQNWEKKIKEGKKIIEIENIKRQVLADIQARRRDKRNNSVRPKTSPWKLVIPLLSLIAVSLVILVVLGKRVIKRRKRSK